jgi:hypothetical protein
MDESDRFKLYQALLASAAEQLGCEPTAEKAKDLATLRLMRESVTLKLIAGKDCNPSDLRWLTEELAKFAPPEPPIKVQIEVVGEGGKPISALPYEDPPPDSSPPSGGGGGPAPADSAPAAAQTANVVPFTRSDTAPAAAAPWRSPTAGGSINDSQMPDGSRPPIVRRASGFYPGYDTIAGPFSAVGERPNFEAGHSLPDADPRHYLPTRSDGTVSFAGAASNFRKRDRDPGGHGGSVCW